jgi:rSAM/selenodomain-associated transferase 1
VLSELRREVERLAMQRRALGIMGKVPTAGQVKTRLSPPLTLEHTALLYSAFLRDVMLLGLNVPRCDVSVVLPEGSDERQLHDLAPAGVSFVQQPGNGLGAGLRGAIQLLLAGGARSVALIGSDSPTLPSSHIERAFELLERDCADIVLGPAGDGGYYLIAVRQDHPRLFEDITWSSNLVMDQTLERAREANLRVELVPEWYDIDDGESLDRLVTDLGADGHLAAPATRVAIRTLRRMGADLPRSPIPWTVLSTEIPYRDPRRSLVQETLLTHRGEDAAYSYLDAADAVWIVPVTKQGEIVLIRQYRHPVRDWVLEVPAGGLDGDSMHAAAVKELREEVGGTGGDVSYVGAFYSSSGQMTLRALVFVALGVELGETELESTELLEPVIVPAELAFDMARRGEINDGQSALAVLFCESAIRAWLR